MGARIAVKKTSPATVVADYGSLMRLAAYAEALDKKKATNIIIGNNWDIWYPATSTAPWQLEGVLRTLLVDGFPKESLVLVSAGAAADSGAAELNNGQLSAAARLGFEITHLYEPPVKWISYQPQVRMLALDELIAREGFYIPDIFHGGNVIHLPTLKTDLLATTAGAAESAFRSLAPGRRRLATRHIHEAIVDILAIQREIHAGVFAVMDAVFCGGGAGPRMLVPYEKGYILAGADQVAIDAVAAHMMGFDPMEIGYIRLAHEQGLGCGKFDEIEVVGDDIAEVNFHFCGPGGDGADADAGSCRRPRYSGGWLETLPGRLSRLGLDSYWYPFVGRSRVYAMAETQWGQLIQSYLPSAARLERQGRSRGALLAALAAAGFLGLSAFLRVARLARSV